LLRAHPARSRPETRGKRGTWPGGRTSAGAPLPDLPAIAWFGKRRVWTSHLWWRTLGSRFRASDGARGVVASTLRQGSGDVPSDSSRHSHPRWLEAARRFRSTTDVRCRRCNRHRRSGAREPPQSRRRSATRAIRGPTRRHRSPGRSRVGSSHARTARRRRPGRGSAPSFPECVAGVPERYRPRGARAAGVRPGGPRRRAVSEWADVLCLVALLAATNVELDPLAFLQGLVPLTLNRGEVDEHIISLFPRDEPVTLVRVEELDRTLCHNTRFSSRPASRAPAGSHHERSGAPVRP